jgi:hypothetical protein
MVLEGGTSLSILFDFVRRGFETLGQDTAKSVLVSLLSRP